MNKKFMYWWLVFISSLSLFLLSIYLDLHIYIYLKDKSFMAFTIMLLYIITSIWVGKQIFYKKTVDYFGNFFCNLFMGLGLLGTVIGFLFIANALENVNLSDLIQLQRSMGNILVGLSSAFIATATGLIMSILLNIQLLIANYND